MRKAGTSSTMVLGILAVIGVLFGVLTLISGGKVLFGDGAARAASGNYVGFVLWFNFIAGFAYILAGAGLLLGQRWATTLSGVIAGATFLVFAALGIHIMIGGAFELRTIGAMVLRCGFWLAFTAAALASWQKKTET